MSRLYFLIFCKKYAFKTMYQIAQAGPSGAGSSHRPTDGPFLAVQAKMTQDQRFFDRSQISKTPFFPDLAKPVKKGIKVFRN
jgi:hypothetical protein